MKLYCGFLVKISLKNEYLICRRAECETCKGLGFPPVQGDLLSFMDVTNDGLKIDVNPDEEEIDFWQSIEKKLKKYHGIDIEEDHDEL